MSAPARRILINAVTIGGLGLFFRVFFSGIWDSLRLSGKLTRNLESLLFVVAEVIANFGLPLSASLIGAFVVVRHLDRIGAVDREDVLETLFEEDD
ncbi:hypothetical protein [Georgenia muralis]